MSDRPYTPRIVDGELSELLDGLPAVLVEGARGVGKTATASRRASSVYLLDDPVQRETVLADPNAIMNSRPPVLIDEWQFAPALWDGVRRAVDRGAVAGSFMLTGSSSGIGTGTHSGAGRIVSLRMRPMSLFERLASPATVSLAALLAHEQPAIGGTSGLRLADYVDEILRSGFPGLRGLQGRPLRSALDGYLARIVDRDFPELGLHVRNPASLRRWLQAYAAATSTNASFETIRDASTGGEGDKPARSTVGPYRDVLERLYLLDPVPGWIPTTNRLGRLTTTPKHHLVDPALAAQLVAADASGLIAGALPAISIPRDGSFLGALFESLVTQSVRVYAQQSEAVMAHFRDHGGRHEVDLIVERRDGRILAIEVKLAQIPTDHDVRHLLWLRRELGEQMLDAVVITAGPRAYRRADGIAVVPAALLGP